MPKPRVPTETKIIQGTFRAERENPDEPVYEVEIPDPPKHLSERALKEWARMSEALFKQGLLTAVDRACLAAYCQLYGRWEEAEVKLKTQEIAIITSTGAVIQNPLVGIANTAIKLMHKCLIEFGMTPASRAKVSSKPGSKKKDPWEKVGKKKAVK